KGAHGSAVQAPEQSVPGFSRGRRGWPPRPPSARCSTARRQNSVDDRWPDRGRDRCIWRQRRSRRPMRDSRSGEREIETPERLGRQDVLAQERRCTPQDWRLPVKVSGEALDSLIVLLLIPISYALALVADIT